MSDHAVTPDSARPVVLVQHVSMAYKLYAKPIDMLKEALFGGARHDTFWALRDISLSVYEGERLGIVGPNGAGKTTLLQLIAGTLSPTAGRVSVNGRISSLLTQTPAWNPDETGLRNARFNLLMQGIPERRIPHLIEEIIDFTELGPFIYQPVRTYSSGMTARLMFAIATAAEPEILIIDEVLGAGDGYFAGKAAKRMREFCARGRALLFVSHATTAVRMMCDRCIWMENGQVRAQGSVDDIVREYETDTLDRQDEALREGNRRRNAALQHVVTPEDLDSESIMRMRIRSEAADPRIVGSYYIRNLLIKIGETLTGVPTDILDIRNDDVIAALDVYSSEWGRVYDRVGAPCRALLPRTGKRRGGHFLVKRPGKEAENYSPIEASFEMATDGAEGLLTIDYVDVVSAQWVSLELIDRVRLDRNWTRVRLRGTLLPSQQVITGKHKSQGSIADDVSESADASKIEPSSVIRATSFEIALATATEVTQKPVVVESVTLMVNDRPALSVMEFQPFSIRVMLTHHEAMPEVSVNLNISRSDGAYVFYQPSGLDGHNITNFTGHSAVSFHFDPNPFGTGQYEVNVFICNGFSWDNIPPSEVFDRSLANLIFNIYQARPISFGLVNILVPVAIDLAPPDLQDHCMNIKLS